MADLTRIRALCLLLALISSACSPAGKHATSSEKAPPAPAKPEASAPSVPASAPSMPARADTSTPTTISESEARALLDRWRDAQNSGDFAAYSALYAKRFQGIKRVGLRSERYDHDGWLRDRKRMFEKPLHVETADVEITTTCCAASVRFVQSFTSGTFQDRGPKELRLVPDEGGLHIASEEMLSSSIEQASPATELAASDLRFVVHTKRTYVVIGFDGHDEQGEGDPQLDDTALSVASTRKALKPDAVLPEVTAARGKPVRLYGAEGLACSAKLGKAYLLRRVVPHFGTVQHWTGSDAIDGEPHPAVAPDVVAREAWDEAAQQTLVVAALDDVQGDCRRALWALWPREDVTANTADHAAHEPEIFRPGAVPDQLGKRVIERVRKLPAYLKIQREYAALRADYPTDEAASMPPAWEHFDGAQPELRRWQHGARTFVSFEAHAGGCADLGGALWALFEVAGSTLVLLNSPGAASEPAEFSIGAIIDTNGDGSIEILGGGWSNTENEANALMRATRKGVRFVRDIYPPFHDCGC